MIRLPEAVECCRFAIYLIMTVNGASLEFRRDNLSSKASERRNNLNSKAPERLDYNSKAPERRDNLNSKASERLADTERIVVAVAEDKENTALDEAQHTETYDHPEDTDLSSKASDRLADTERIVVALVEAEKDMACMAHVTEKGRDHTLVAVDLDTAHMERQPTGAAAKAEEFGRAERIELARRVVNDKHLQVELKELRELREQKEQEQKELKEQKKESLLGHQLEENLFPGKNLEEEQSKRC